MKTQKKNRPRPRNLKYETFECETGREAPRPRGATGARFD